MTAIHHMSATALSEVIASGSISCVETMQAFLTQIEATNPAVNALINLDPPEHCLALAAKADEALRAGQRKGWLHGMPIAIKDLAGAADFQTTFGSRIFESFIATEDDPHVARIRAAGAIIIGKTNVPEWGLGGHTQNSLHGLTRNALDHRLTAGGSSGGAATALASHMLPLADGSDMMGSSEHPPRFKASLDFAPRRVAYLPQLSWTHSSSSLSVWAPWREMSPIRAPCLRRCADRRLTDPLSIPTEFASDGSVTREDTGPPRQVSLIIANAHSRACLRQALLSSTAHHHLCLGTSGNAG